MLQMIIELVCITVGSVLTAGLLILIIVSICYTELYYRLFESKELKYG
jgi:hypothetical protein